MKTKLVTILPIVIILMITNIYNSLALTFVVDNVSDVDPGSAYVAGDGTNSLRKCIRHSNDAAGADIINFTLGGGPYLIVLTSGLPALTSPVTINGYSQAGSGAGTLLIEVNANATAGAVLELQAGSDGSTIRGLIMNGANRGIFLNGSGNNIIRGNYIGTNATGMALATNPVDWSGIQLDNSASNVIGGNGGQIDRNIISGIRERGISVWAGNCTGNVIINNYIGVNSNGTLALSNLNEGIYVNPGVDFSNSKIGGVTPDSANVISGNNASGINLNTSTNCRIMGNYIGTSATGNAAIPNGQFGIILNTCNNTNIGNAVAGSGNVISGNSWDGIYIINSTDCSIKGNKIGIGANGTTVLPNSVGVNILMGSHRVVIGGVTANERNIISGNNGIGVRILDSNNGIIAGNYIGLIATGNTRAANQGNGVALENAQATTIGGSVAGAGNVISGNLWDGVYIFSSSDCIVKGNILGLGADGMTIIANTVFQDMVKLRMGSLRTVIGGQTANERNVISNSGSAGISMLEASNFTLVEGNYIGTDRTGLIARGNAYAGIYIDACTDVIIGGVNVRCRNIISANIDNGISVLNSSNRTIIKANFIGLDVNGGGGAGMGNGQQGIYIGGNSNNCIVGGSTLAERNVCSQNGDKIGGTTGDGIRIIDASFAVIKGNWCGTDSTGLIKKGNVWAGISINEANGTIIGGTGLFERNVCSGNWNEGIYFRNATNTRVINNYVGPGVDGITPIGNEDFGINIRSIPPLLSSDNIIGGHTAFANVIAYNVSAISPLAPGVYVDANEQRNQITFNKIYCNGGLGIELAVGANENVLPPFVTSSGANILSGTGIAGDSIHIYNNVRIGGDCDCEGEVYVGRAIVTAGGTWTITHGLGLTQSQADRLTATQTTPAKSTSQFSVCANPLPVQMLSFTAYLKDNSTVLLNWATYFEVNNLKFEVERSSDGVTFEKIGEVNGSGTTSTVHQYQFTDEEYLGGIIYYRLNQIDINGEHAYSSIVSVQVPEATILYWLNDNNLIIVTNFNQSQEVSYSIHSVTGALIKSGQYNALKDVTLNSVTLKNLPPAVYILSIQSSSDVLTGKIITGN